MMGEAANGVEVTAAIYHRENGRTAGCSIIEADGRRIAARACLNPGAHHRDQHVWFVARGDDANGRLCQCGKFRRRVLPECPACGRKYYSVAEPIDAPRSEDGR